MHASDSPFSNQPRRRAQASVAGLYFSPLWLGRAKAIIGLMFAGFSVMALASWNVADPSFSHATDNAVTNWMGFPGAVVADLLMQFLGLACLFVIAPMLVRAVAGLRGRPSAAMPHAALFWIGGILLGAASVSLLPAPQKWPLPTGLGGVFGDMLLKVPGVFTGGYPSGLFALLLAVILFPAAGWCLWKAMFATGEAQPASDAVHAGGTGWESLHPAISVGALIHGWYSLTTMVRRALRLPTRRERAPAPQRQQRRAAPEASFDMAHDPWAGQSVAPEPIDRDWVDDQSAGYEPVRRDGSAEAWPGMNRAQAAAHTDPYRAHVDPHETDHAAMDHHEHWTPQPDGYATTHGAVGDTYGYDETVAYTAPEPQPVHVQPVQVQPIHAQPSFEPELQPQPRVMQAPAPLPTPVPVAPPAMRAAPVARQPQPPLPAREPVQPSRVTPAAPPPAPGTRVQREARARTAGHGGFELPSLHFLSDVPASARHSGLSEKVLEQNARRLESVLEDFGVKGEIMQVQPGPVVTLYELEPAPGIKSSRVIGLAEDIARSMSAIAARVAVIPGRNAIGIELPNETRETVYLRELLASQTYEKSHAKLSLALGKTINGDSVIADLAKMPHLLVAGTTGSGKSVAINTMILSLLYKMTPEQCRLIMIDPKMLELSVYDGIPHLLTPVVTDPKKAVVALKWTVREMENRYRNMAKLGVRNIDGYNARVGEAEAKGEVLERTVQTGFDRESGEAVYESERLDLEAMPYIVVIIDEMADLMMVAGKEIEGTVQRLAQMARAAGIHVIMATQRPSVDVITGTIKANFPTRISFQVTSKIDSRTILGEQGAEQLLGMGDMLYMAGGGRIQRVHGPFVADEEVEDVVKHLKTQGVPQYLEAVTEDEDEDGGEPAASGSGGSIGEMADSDDPYDQAVAIVLRDRKASTSYIQRRLGIGYNRAASLIERMEQEGVISEANHAGKRDILVPGEDEQQAGL